MEKLEGLAFVLGCEVGDLLTTYLGYSWCAPSNSLVVWDGVEERFCQRLKIMKIQYISKGGG